MRKQRRGAAQGRPEEAGAGTRSVWAGGVRAPPAAPRELDGSSTAAATPLLASGTAGTVRGGDTAGWAGDSPAEGQSIAEWEGQSRAERGRTDSRGVGRAERGRIDSSGAGRPSSRAGSEGSAPPHVPRALAGRSGQWGSGAGPAESRESGALRAGGTMLRAVAAQRLRRAVSAGRARRAPGTERGLPAPGRAGPAPGAEGARRGARGPAPPARQPWSGVAER